MSILQKFTLAFDHKKDNWKLENDKTDKIVRHFETKEDATKRDVLKRALGSEGGSVRIEFKNKSGYDEERTYPRSADPRKSKG
jgi:hypothetical protein